ncbi:MAG: signal peptidase I [Victivallaceae bacterium]
MQFLKKILALTFSCWRVNQDKIAPRSLTDFVFPQLNRYFFMRLAITIAVCYLVFGFILIPCFIKGGSMEPTYKSIGFDFCWRGKYLFSPPKRGDVIIVKYTDKVLLLKRIVAFEGETVEFRNGYLYINGLQYDEPYLYYPCLWELPPRKVKKNHVYAIGDNRSMSINQHVFGQFDKKRIYGAPIW